ncbi:MAG: hypothetical protein B6U97_02230 [Candidatus Altiarchaeales archaeon ex4484_96]|nr:MAG: hypothetical protein B6U97_02230 [Candidatus Altiarchaeales archaeon ex4484_96]
MDRYMVYVEGGDKPSVNVCRLGEDNKEELIGSYEDAAETLDDMAELILVDSKVFHQMKNR